MEPEQITNCPNTFKCEIGECSDCGRECLLPLKHNGVCIKCFGKGVDNPETQDTIRT